MMNHAHKQGTRSRAQRRKQAGPILPAAWPCIWGVFLVQEPRNDMYAGRYPKVWIMVFPRVTLFFRLLPPGHSAGSLAVPSDSGPWMRWSAILCQHYSRRFLRERDSHAARSCTSACADRLRSMVGYAKGLTDMRLMAVLRKV